MTKEQDIEWLSDAWHELVSSYGDYPSTADAWFSNIVDAYGEVGRVYHTNRHLRATVRDVQLLAMREKIHDPRLAEWAAWFHDYVYIPGNPRNEELSAEVAEKCLLAFGFQNYTTDRVVDLIMDTQTHKPVTLQGYILCDADMAILAANEHTYIQYAKMLRLEFSQFTNEQWAEGRSEFLRKTLKDGHIFHTESCKKLEHYARENMVRELLTLKEAATA